MAWSRRSQLDRAAEAPPYPFGPAPADQRDRPVISPGRLPARSRSRSGPTQRGAAWIHSEFGLCYFFLGIGLRIWLDLEACKLHIKLAT
jgi:hypothetical protein